MVTLTLGVIEAVDAVYQGQAQTGGALHSSYEISMVRGAIIGALIVGLGFLALQSFLRRGAITYSAAFMVGSAAALEIFWLGFLPVPSSNILVLMQGLFGASVVIFLSTSVRLARHHAGLGGVLFAASLVFVGIGIINFLGRADFASAMVRALVGVSVFAVGFTGYQAVKGDVGARMVFPGAVLVLLATASLVTGIGGPLWGHGLLTLGLIAASMVTLSEKPARQLAEDFGRASPLGAAPMGTPPLETGFAPRTSSGQKQEQEQQMFTKAAETSPAQTPQAERFFDAPASEEHGMAVPAGRKPTISGERLVEVLDFSGIGVWDWSLDGVYQSTSLCEMLGADCDADFTPEALRAFVMPSHLGLFEAEVFGHGTGDGGFDTQIILHNGAPMRLRGARAVDSAGRLERVVAFFETPLPMPAGASDAPVSGEKASLTSPMPAQASGVKTASTDPSPTQNAVSIPLEAADEVSQNVAPPFVAFTAAPITALGSGERVGFDLHLDAFALGAGTANGGLDWGHRPVVENTLAQAASFLDDQHRAARRAGAKTRVASDAFVSLSLPYKEFSGPGRVDEITKAILASGLSYGTLVLAISGLDQVQDMAATKAQLAALRQAGARLAFADGMDGRGALGLVHRFDFDLIAVDKELTARMGEDRACAAHVKTLSTLGRDLGLRVIAYGVDTDHQYAALSDLGCSFAAGQKIADPIAMAPVAGETVSATAIASATPPERDSQTAFAAAPAEEGISLDAVSSLSFPSRAPDTASASPVPPADLNPEMAEPGGAPLGTSAEGTGEDHMPIKKLEEAFAKTVPAFDPAPLGTPAETALPKWRTWVKNMR
ncbi:MAG: EAL domain-containing protein [Pseudomonadota bacterium]